jgi:3-oxoacyl-[acyl-carrier protein] reductase
MLAILGRVFDRHPFDDWRRIVDVNLVGTMQMTKAVLPYMLRQGSGRIINLASLAGKEAQPDRSPAALASRPLAAG